MNSKKKSQIEREITQKTALYIISENTPQPTGPRAHLATPSMLHLTQWQDGGFQTTWRILGALR